MTGARSVNTRFQVVQCSIERREQADRGKPNQAHIMSAEEAKTEMPVAEELKVRGTGSPE